MFSLFIALLIFNESLARGRTICVSLNDERCMIRPTLIDLNPVELKYYWFMISLDKCTWSCNVKSPKICFPKETKDINVTSFKMTNENETKTTTKHISCDCKCKFNSTTCNSNQEWNNKTRQCQCKNYWRCEKDYSWSPSICICENSNYLKSIADTLVIKCDETISIMNIVSKIKRSTIVTNVTKIFHSK